MTVFKNSGKIKTLSDKLELSDLLPADLHCKKNVLQAEGKWYEMEM